MFGRENDAGDVLQDGEDLLGKDIEDVAPGPDVEAQRGPARRFTPRGCFCSVRDSLAGRIRDFKGAGKQRPQRAELLQVMLPCCPPPPPPSPQQLLAVASRILTRGQAIPESEILQQDCFISSQLLKRVFCCAILLVTLL